MANVLTVISTIVNRGNPNEKRVRYTVTLSGNYVQAVANSNVGELAAFNSAVNSAFKINPYWGLKGPKIVEVLNPPDGYGIELYPAADGLHRLIRITTTSDTELAAGAYPADLAADTQFQIEACGSITD